MVVTILPTFNRTHLPFFKGVFLISGVFACDLILLMLVPPFGWFICTICASVMVLLLYRSRRQILKLCQEIIESLGHSTSKALHGLCDWFQQSFQSILGFSRSPASCSSGTSMCSPSCSAPRRRSMHPSARPSSRSSSATPTCRMRSHSTRPRSMPPA